MHEIADAADIDDDMVGADEIHPSGELPDHEASAAAMRERVPAR